ncbi:DUF572-domain-containing protein [Corynespora cassiicola Philippines]|uniref:DUF572-domain-containing protein n=1 Tax=Corynespora cassiicola Philippines TaxID=1448308 RepID=A0A2T2PCC5_CORCC|nr:DUF572-domain-containing protein [Corynespora cassiicola Philippines]
MQGFNMGRYYPPDASNPPQFNASHHPLGSRARKSSQGILTVRFELPFAVWCATCAPAALVGQGVRFNAEKKKVGNYYSTPIWSFRMKHSACGAWWEIRTDPQNSRYVVVEGARERDYGEVRAGEGEMAFLSEGERERRREDAFAALEGRVEDKGNEKKSRERVEELYEMSEVWRDADERNAKLRREFRAKRRVWKEEDKYREGLQDKFSLGLDIVDEVVSDGVRAKLVEFGGTQGIDRKVEEAARKPLFADQQREKASSSSDASSRPGKLRSEIRAEKSRQTLQKTLLGNTRAVVDPFLSNSATSTPKFNPVIIKRKRDADTVAESKPAEKTERQLEASKEEPPAKKPALALVDYDSD